jgi:hypothetical protein
MTLIVSFYAKSNDQYDYLKFLRSNAIYALNEFMQMPEGAPHRAMRSAQQLKMLLTASQTSSRDWTDYPDLMHKMLLISKTAPHFSNPIDKEKLYQLNEFYREQVEKAQMMKEQWGIFHSVQDY